MGYSGSRPKGGSVRNFSPKKIGMSDRIAAPEAKQANVKSPQMKSLSSQMNMSRNRTSLLDFCHLALRSSLRSSGVVPLIKGMPRYFMVVRLYHKGVVYGR